MKRTYTSLLIGFSLFFFTLSAFPQIVAKTLQTSSDYNGSTDIMDVYSPALEGNLQGNSATQAVKVYLPPNYDNFPNNRYPVIILLHQFTTDYNAYFEDHNIVKKLDRLISEKTINPMIIVTPNAYTIYEGSGFTNSYVSGNWEEYIAIDVVQHIENNYNVIDRSVSRGIGGFSSAGYGTLNIAMKHPAKLGVMGIIGAAFLDLEETILNDPFKSWIIEAAEINEYRPGDPWYIHAMYSWAVDFAPDSTVKPILGSLPYSAEGELIDSTWQKWMEHDPLTRLEIYDDSLKKLNAIQIYIGNQDNMHIPSHAVFHQALTDKGIDHGYDSYSGDHNPEPVLEDLLEYFSESLVSVVPLVTLVSENSLLKTETLVLKSDLDGELFVVPASVYQDIDSIIEYKITSAIVTANEEKEIDLSGFEPGNYLVYAISNDNMVSNIPAEFEIFTSVDINDLSPLTSYPNPVAEILRIETKIPGQYELLITSISGRLIFSKKFNGTKTELDLSALVKGIYIITIKSDDIFRTEKIMKL